MPAVDRGALWNEAERVWANAGGGKELVAKRYEFALPIELDERGRRECVRDFCALFPTRACDWAIHDDGRGGNPHAHVLVSALDLGAEGFIPRTRSDKGQSWYLCENDGGERIVVPATDWAAAKAAGWQKLYNFKDGKRRTMRKAKAEGLGTKDRVSKSPVKMHRRDGQSAREARRNSSSRSAPPGRISPTDTLRSTPRPRAPRRSQSTTAVIKIEGWTSSRPSMRAALA